MNVFYGNDSVDRTYLSVYSVAAGSRSGILCQALYVVAKQDRGDPGGTGGLSWVEPETSEGYGKGSGVRKSRPDGTDILISEVLLLINIGTLRNIKLRKDMGI